MKKGEIKMNYKEEYQKALERAKKGLPIDEVFPELKESEDERIRNELIEYLTHRAEVTGFVDEDKDCKRWIAYLEKQKERERIVPEREATDFEIEVHEIIAQARSDKRLADKDVLEQFEREAACALMWKAEKQKEQKPAEWSEEDKKMARFIGNAITTDEASKYLEEKHIKIIDAHVWLEQKLKSLRPHWKPSEEQMKALERAEDYLIESDNEDAEIIGNLYNDLKKQM